MLIYSKLHSHVITNFLLLNVTSPMEDMLLTKIGTESRVWKDTNKKALLSTNNIIGETPPRCFRVLQKSKNEFHCLLHEMLFVMAPKPQYSENWYK